MLSGITYPEQVMRLGILLLLFSLSVTDIRKRRIPTEFILAGACFFYLYVFSIWNVEGYQAARQRFISGAAGACILFILTFTVAIISGLFLRKNALGGADIRLFSLLGLCFGTSKGLYTILLTCVAALFYLKSAGKKEIRKNTAGEFPLVPCICIAYAVVMLF